ncbi:MAG TPA: porin family protein [Puia sp.]|nr:porin family protein [Puia sp.]
MKKYILLLPLLVPLALFSQQPTVQPTPQTKPKPAGHHSIGIGVEAGFNFANVTNASAINASSRAGYHFGLFLAPDSKSVLGSRTELLYSRHGYNYKTDTSRGAVNLDYIMLTQMMAIHITKYFELDLGGYTAYLLNAKDDSMSKALQGTPYASYSSMLSFYNRFDYGFGAGAEVHPVAGLLVGVRYQLSFSNLLKTAGSGGQNPSTYSPSLNLKNNVVMLSVGYRF